MRFMMIVNNKVLTLVCTITVCIIIDLVYNRWFGLLHFYTRGESIRTYIFVLGFKQADYVDKVTVISSTLKEGTSGFTIDYKVNWTVNRGT